MSYVSFHVAPLMPVTINTGVGNWIAVYMATNFRREINEARKIDAAKRLEQYRQIERVRKQHQSGWTF